MSGGVGESAAPGQVARKDTVGGPRGRLMLGYWIGLAQQGAP